MEALIPPPIPLAYRDLTEAELARASEWASKIERREDGLALLSFDKAASHRTWLSIEHRINPERWPAPEPEPQPTRTEPFHYWRNELPEMLRRYGDPGTPLPENFLPRPIEPANMVNVDDEFAMFFEAIDGFRRYILDLRAGVAALPRWCQTPEEREASELLKPASEYVPMLALVPPPDDGEEPDPLWFMPGSIC
jgi:hypothetical protein